MAGLYLRSVSSDLEFFFTKAQRFSLSSVTIKSLCLMAVLQKVQVNERIVTTLMSVLGTPLKLTIVVVVFNHP